MSEQNWIAILPRAKTPSVSLLIVKSEIDIHSEDMVRDYFPWHWFFYHFQICFSTWNIQTLHKCRALFWQGSCNHRISENRNENGDDPNPSSQSSSEATLSLSSTTTWTTAWTTTTWTTTWTIVIRSNSIFIINNKGYISQSNKQKII